jgi:hypothetical protein
LKMCWNLPFGCCTTTIPDDHAWTCQCRRWLLVIIFRTLLFESPRYKGVAEELQTISYFAMTPSWQSRGLRLMEYRYYFSKWSRGDQPVFLFYGVLLLWCVVTRHWHITIDQDTPNYNNYSGTWLTSWDLLPSRPPATLQLALVDITVVVVRLSNTVTRPVGSLATF